MGVQTEPMFVNLLVVFLILSELTCPCPLRVPRHDSQGTTESVSLLDFVKVEDKPCVSICQMQEKEIDDIRNGILEDVSKSGIFENHDGFDFEWCDERSLKPHFEWCPDTNHISYQILEPSPPPTIGQPELKVLSNLGHLRIIQNGVNLTAGEYCIIIRDNKFHGVKVCHPQITVQKCCPSHQVINGSSKGAKECINVTQDSLWTPTYYKQGYKLRHRNQSVRRLPKVLPGKMGIGPHKTLSCSTTPYIIQTFRDQKFLHLQANGSMVVVDGRKFYGGGNGESNDDEGGPTTVLAPGNFCIDGIFLPETESGEATYFAENETVSYSGSEWHQGIVICADGRAHENPTWISSLYAAVNHTAAVYLFLTIMVYILLWPSQNIHGWLQFAYALSLFFAFSGLAVVQVWSHLIYEASAYLCRIVGWLIHFSILSSFFWLTSMNFDVWWRFSGGRFMQSLRYKSRRNNLRLFLLFALFSIGMPLLITTTAIILDETFKNEDVETFFFRLPKFGAKKCYFRDKMSQFPFLYLPIGVLLLINLLFFSGTVVHLRRIHSNVEMAINQSTAEDKKGLRLIAKLFVVMGVLWIFEFVSWATHMAFPDSEKLLDWIFMPTEIINSLQGVAIFVIFVCKQNVLGQLSCKLGSLKLR